MAKPSKKVKEIDPLTMSFRPPQVARVTDLGLRTVETLISTGKLRSMRIGRCRVVRRKDLEDFLERQVTAAS
jgi:excisionase family DNA binding protein